MMGSGYENRKWVPLWQVITICLVVAIVSGLVVGGVLSFGNRGGNALADNGNSDSKVVSYTPSGSGDAAAVGQKVSPSVVFISNIVNARTFMSSGAQEVTASTGSGVIYSQDGYIITNNHVVDGASKISVKLYDGTSYIAEVVGTDPRTDLAVIKIDATGLQPADFGDSDQLVMGELAVAIGNPAGENFANSLTQGVISGLNRTIETEDGVQLKLVQTDAAINPGNSGGALCNGKGQVIGINTIKISIAGYEGMGFAIPSNTVMDISKQLIENGKVTRPALGVSIYTNVTKQLAYYNDLAVDYGVMVLTLADGSSEKAGLKNYDIIIAVDDQKVETGGQLQDIIFSKKIGDTVKVTVQRDQEKLNFDVTLGELQK